MRDRIIIAVCVLSVVGLFAGIAVFGPHEGQAGDQATNPATRPPGGPAQVLSLGGPFFKLFFDPDYPDSSQPVTFSGSRGATARASLSPAGVAAPAPAAAPAVVQVAPQRVCAPSLLGSVVGLLGGLVGGGGGC